MTIVQAIQFIVGINVLFMSISMLFQTEVWVDWCQNIKKQGKRASLSIGMINLLVGAFIVSFHPVWEGIPVIVTIFGLIGILKGIVYLSVPGWLPEKLGMMAKNFETFIKAAGFIFIVFAGFVLNEWWQQTSYLF